MSALPSDDPAEDEALFVLPPEDVPPFIVQGEYFGRGSDFRVVPNEHRGPKPPKPVVPKRGDHSG